MASAAELERWVGEPVRAVVVSPRAFVSNKRGFPVLPKRHQEFVQRMIGRGYTERQVRRLVEWYMRVDKAG